MEGQLVVVSLGHFHAAGCPATAQSGTFHVSSDLQVLDLCRKDFKTQVQVKVRASLLKLRTVRQRRIDRIRG